MSAAIHEQSSCITSMELIKASTPQLMSENIIITTSTPKQGVPIISNTSLYTTYQQKKTRNSYGILPLTYVTTYARKDDVPNGDGTLFAVDHIYPESKKDKSSRFFRMNFIEFYQRLMVTPKGNRCYYECIEGDERKPYADIEYEYTDDNKDKAFEDFDQLIGYILLGIQYEMHDKGVDYLEDRDCIKLSSHGPGKRSIHIIINNYYFDKCGDVHNSNVKSFWLAVRNRVPQHLWHFSKIKHGSEVIEYQVEVNPDMPLIFGEVRTSKKKDLSETIDTCVYSSFRQFRLIWNTKLGKDRFLDIDPSTGTQARFPKNHDDPDILDDNIQCLRLFEGCLITMTSNCKKLPDWITPVVDTNKENAFKNLVDIDDKQRNALIDAFNASRHSHIYRINYNQTTDKNSIYLDPITKPYDCLICGGNHSSNNAKVCYSAKGNIYIKCFASNMIDYIGKDTINESEDDDASDFEGDSLEFLGLDDDFLQYAQQNGIEVPDYLIKSIESNFINESTNNKLDGNLSQMEQQRVQATPIIGSLIQQQSVENLFIRASPTSGTVDVNHSPIINIKTTMKEGQIVPPCSTTTIASFLDGNTKFLAGYEYIIQEVFNAYDRYRSGKGTKYCINGGGDKSNFGRVLTSLGHTTNQKKVKGSKVRVVTLKRPDPIVNTNPAEVLNAISGKAPSPALKPDDALALLEQASTNTPQTPTTSIPEPATLINTDLRVMNPHVDVRNFWDIYMTQDPDSNTDPDNLFKCFLEYCKQNNALPKLFGQTRLINYLKKWLNIDSFKGWRCKTDMEEIENAKKEKNLRRIWTFNNAPYQIGWRNGRFIERHCKLTSKPWKNIDVHYRQDEYCRPIPQLIEMTKEFEKNLPDRVKEIQDRQTLLLYLPICNEEAENLKKILTNALVDGIIIKDSPDHLMLKNRITELEQETSRLSREEYNRLKMIKQD